MTPPEPHDPVAVGHAANAWAARLREGLDEAGRRDLLAWLARDPQHREALARVAPARDELDWPLYAGHSETVFVGVQRRARRRRVRRLSLAAVGLVMVGVGVVGFRIPDLLFPPPPAASLLVLQPERRLLPDGSVVVLKPGAEIVDDFSDERYRFVTLRQGAAHFDVASNPARPFVVRAGTIAVRAVGTAFAVERVDGDVSVVITHGRVAVGEAAAPAASTSDAPPAPAPEQRWLAEAPAGNRIDVRGATAGAEPAQASVCAVPEAELASALGWRNPRLEFSAASLRDVVEAFNRHNRVQLTIEEPALEVLRLSGTLRADKVESLLHILDIDFAIAAERRSEWQIALKRKRP